MKQKVTLSSQNNIVSVISRKGIKSLIIVMFRNTRAAHPDQQAAAALQFITNLRAFKQLFSKTSRSQSFTSSSNVVVVLPVKGFDE